MGCCAYYTSMGDRFELAVAVSVHVLAAVSVAPLLSGIL
jgi:hypothetical protein